jgi:GNAT superfamily N-acetyltransferase
VDVVVRELPSQRPATAAVRARLQAHFARALDCDATLLSRPGVTIIPTEARRGPEWHGWVLPLYGVAPAGTGSCVLSCLPELADPLREALASLPPSVHVMDARWVAAVRAACGGLAEGEWSECMIYVADPATFRQYGIDPSIRVERLDVERQRDLWLARAFDGPCFIIWSGGSIASWAGTKCKSDDVWEIAAVTDAPFRGRGLATLLTATATEEILKTGRLALWVADHDNTGSRRLVERLGYQPYGEMVTLSRFDPTLLPRPPRGSP